MSEETSAEVREEVVQTADAGQEQAPEPEKQVPLSALEAERRKRQEAEQQAQWLYQQMQAAQATYKTPEPQEEEDEYTRELDQRFTSKVEKKLQSFAEQQFVESRPEAVNLIQEHLPQILKQKPWLAQTIQSAPNRYARALEIVNDYAPRNTPPPDSRRRIEENAQKPGSPQGVGKTSQISKLEMLSKMSPQEFSEYRKRVRSGQH